MIALVFVPSVAILDSMTDKKAFTLSLPVDEITERRSEHLRLGGTRERRTRTVADPLLEAGVTILCIARMPHYEMKKPRPENIHRIALMVQGQMTFTLEDKQFTVGPGHLVVTPALCMTQRRSHGAIEWIYIDIDPLPLWNPLYERGGYTRAYESADLMYILTRRILDAHRDMDEFSVRCAFENCETLLKLLKREIALPNQKTVTRVQALATLCDRIREDPGANWTCAMMAKKLNVTERQMNRIFMKTYGHPPLQTVIQIRMHRVAELLVETKQSLGTIARQVGYKSAFSLSRVFTKHMGLAPKAYRKQHR